MGGALLDWALVRQRQGGRRAGRRRPPARPSPAPSSLLQGAAAIASPAHNLPLAALAAGVSFLRGRSARRGGKPPPSLPSAADLAHTGPVDIVFDGVTVTVPAGRGSKAGSKNALMRVSGAARAGRLTAIMGPSGGGKTTLLHVLAGQLAAAPGVKATGRVAATVAGAPGVAAPRPRAAFVRQDDAFFSMLTVSETVDMAAHLRARAGGEEGEAADEARGLVAALGLASSASSRVGGPRARGLSGGERKRLAIACELVGSPPVLFADEPTSGLDAFAAGRVVSALAALAAAGRTVVASVHQPRSSAFAQFDDLILLSGGRVVYGGAAREAVAHFAALGHACPPATNPAEFLADLVAVDHASPEAAAESGARVDALVAAWAARGEAGSVAAATTLPGAAAAPPPRAPLATQARLLLTRAWRQATRDKAATLARAASSLSSALIFGSIFWRLPRTQASIQDRLGLIQVASINAAMSSLVKTLAVFPVERRVVERERARGGYGAAPYFLSKLLAEFPLGAAFPLMFGAAVYPACGLNPKPARVARFLGLLTLESFSATALGLAVGAGAPSPEAATALGPAIMVVFIVFGGEERREGGARLGAARAPTCLSSPLPRRLRQPRVRPPPPALGAARVSDQARVRRVGGQRVPGADLRPDARGGGRARRRRPRRRAGRPPRRRRRPGPPGLRGVDRRRHRGGAGARPGVQRVDRARAAARARAALRAGRRHGGGERGRGGGRVNRV